MTSLQFFSRCTVAAPRMHHLKARIIYKASARPEIILWKICFVPLDAAAAAAVPRHEYL